MPAFGGFWACWRQAITPAGYRGALCFGRNRGAKVTYRLPPAFTPVRDAGVELVRRYLHSVANGGEQFGEIQPLDETSRWVYIKDSEGNIIGVFDKKD